jgi:hypothetical protein
VVCPAKVLYEIKFPAAQPEKKVSSSFPVDFEDYFLVHWCANQGFFKEKPMIF